MDGLYVTIPQVEYDQLLEDQAFLYALETAGVDNWNGYAMTHEIYEEGDE
ncbi:hypothetical protein [Macrococcus capreoli]|nr:hypothetical protein [Macrococcus sp. TMW 2.2395]MCU7556582.1 hypothetical protein [Macrococcus sp. TMW 2.2395]